MNQQAPSPTSSSTSSTASQPDPHRDGARDKIRALLALGIAAAAVFTAIGLKQNTRPASGLEGQRAPSVNLAVLPLTATPEVTRVAIPEDLAGKPFVLHFWGPHCQPCLAEAPQLVALHKRAAAEGFELLTVSGDDVQDIRAYMNKSGHTYRVLHDPAGKAHKAFVVSSIPRTLVVDGNGTVTHEADIGERIDTLKIPRR